MGKKALALSGGSIKGAFQAGAIKAVIENGYHPDCLFGISVGSLNSTLLNHEAGKQKLPLEKLDWNLIKDNLIGFWKDHVKKPSDLIIQNGIVKLIINAITGNFDGLCRTDPLKKLVYDMIDPGILRQSPLRHYVGAVNILDGTIIYANPEFPSFLDYVIASAAIPIIMLPVIIKNPDDQPFFDGGMRDVAPLKMAIRENADTVVCILCQPEQLPRESFNHRNLFKLTERVFDIMVDEIHLSSNHSLKTYTPSSGRWRRRTDARSLKKRFT